MKKNKIFIVVLLVGLLALFSACHSFNDQSQTSSNEQEIENLSESSNDSKDALAKDDDVSFGATETPDTDDYGSYYTVQLVDISIRASGKTGNLGYYKVYQDGTYKDFYDDFN